MKIRMISRLRPLRVKARRGLFCLTALISATAAFAGPKMPPGAFLRQPATNVQALSRQISADPLVCKRYARLYNMPVNDVRDAFAHLRLTTLTRDQVFQVHYVHTGERIGYKVRRVRKGTPVYTFADGTPVLVQVCGNPVRTKVSPAHRQTMAPPETELPPAVTEFDSNEALEEIPSNWETAMNGLRGGAPTGQLPPPLDFVEVPEVPIEAPTDTSTTQLHRQPPIQHITNWANGGLLLLPLAALPFLGGHSGSEATPPVTTVSVPPILSPPVTVPPVGPPPVTVVVNATPEPGTVTLFVALTLAGSLAARNYKRHRAY